MFDNNIHLTIDGKDVILNNKQMRQIRDQQMALDASDILECYGVDIDKVDYDTLVKFGYDVQTAVYSDSEEVEYAVLEDYILRGKITKED